MQNKTVNLFYRMYQKKFTVVKSPLNLNFGNVCEDVYAYINSLESSGVFMTKIFRKYKVLCVRGLAWETIIQMASAQNTLAKNRFWFFCQLSKFQII